MPRSGRKAMTKPTLTLALAHYDRTVPLFAGDVGVTGIHLKTLEVGQTIRGRDGERRHERMLQDGEFDAAEVSLSSYLIAKDRGLPFTAIPVFPRRLFSMSQIWRRTEAGIRGPADLAGKRVGLNSYQTTLSVLAKADLQRSYGVSWKNIHWMLGRREIFRFEPPPEVSLTLIPEESKLETLLLAGEIDALIHPHPPRAVLERPDRVARLFPDPRAEETRYTRAFGYFPIMHVIAFRDEVLRASPESARAVFNAFEQAWEICHRRWDDPNWSWLAWGRHAYEDERRALGADLWANGCARNRTNLEWFIEQSREQGLVAGPLPVERLFHPSMLDT